MSFGRNPELSIGEVLEVFNVNMRRAERDLNPSGKRFGVRNGEWGDMSVAAWRSMKGRARKLAAEQTRGQVGDVAWQRFVGASGRGWRSAGRSSSTTLKSQSTT